MSLPIATTDLFALLTAIPLAALGSNVVNIGLIMGLALLFGACSARLGEIRRDYLLTLAVPALTLILALDGALSRGEGVLLLSLFAFWMVMAKRWRIAVPLRRTRRLTRARPSTPGCSPRWA